MSKPRADKAISIPDHLLRKLLTPSEVRMLKNRYLIVQLLNEGLPVRRIAEKVAVGTDTVMRVSRMIEARDIKVNLNRASPSKNRWIFGKSE